MANPHNLHDTLGKSWLEIYAENSTESQHDNTATTTYELQDVNEALQFLGGKVGPTGVASSTTPKDEKTKWAAEEQLKLIVGVASSTRPETGRKNWKYIAENYFKDSKRGENKLKQKWKELKNHAEKKTDDSQKEFYIMVAIVEAETQKKPDGKRKFDNVVREWSWTLEKQDHVIMARAQQRLTMVKKMKPEQQLGKLREWVKEAEQSHAYGKIPYWESGHP